MASAEEDEASRRLWKSLQHASHFRCVSGLTHVKCVFSISMVLLFPLSIWLLHNSSQPGDLLIDGHILCDFNGLHCPVFCPLRCAIALCHLLHRVRLSSNQLEPLHLFYFFLLLFSSTLLLVVSRRLDKLTPVPRRAIVLPCVMIISFMFFFSLSMLYVVADCSLQVFTSSTALSTSPSYLKVFHCLDSLIFLLAFFWLLQVLLSAMLYLYKLNAGLSAIRRDT